MAEESTPADIPVDKAETAAMTVAKSLVLVNTGHGKGKSTAAFGTLIRGVARGWEISVVQFLKGADWVAGEEKILTDLGVDWNKAGGGFTWDSDDLDETAAIAAAAWELAKAKIESGDYRVVLLDEISYAATWGWISTDEVVATLAGRPEKTSVILTGRDMPQAVIDAADTATEMRSIKHAFDSGIVAKKGIDY